MNLQEEMDKLFNEVQDKLANGISTIIRSKYLKLLVDIFL